MNNVAILFCTFPDADTATRIAHTVLDEHLIACATILPIATSIYRWEGAVHSQQEVQVIIKTSHERVTELVARVTELHPYDVPEVLVVDTMGGLPAYIEWVLSSTNDAG